MVCIQGPRRIVRTYTNVNDPTGTTRYVADDGSHWISPGMSEQERRQMTAPPEQRELRGGYLL